MDPGRVQISGVYGTVTVLGTRPGTIIPGVYGTIFIIGTGPGPNIRGVLYGMLTIIEPEQGQNLRCVQSTVTVSEPGQI